MKRKLSEREKKILGAVVDLYIQTAEPVGSHTVRKQYNLKFSPATIRNIMADLKEMGLLFQPHTSAGRIPTELGLRFYIDTLLECQPLKSEQRETIKQRLLKDNYNLEDILKESSRILSTYSHQAGIVLVPRFSNMVLRYIEFVKLKDNLILTILIDSTGSVYHKIIPFNVDITQHDLNRFAIYLNATFTDQPLAEVKHQLVKEMQKDRDKFDEMWADIFQLSQQVLQMDKDKDLYIEGTINILSYPEFADVRAMRLLLKAFEEKSIIVRLLDKTMNERGLQVFIGSEIEEQGLKGCSIIASPYTWGDVVAGTLGVIGSIRMNYSSVIPLVEYTAEVVSDILTKTV
ncbi:MAG: hypothetical protein AMJ45_00195 [Syntrophobacter sp. DG_60]|nr:MAG: hypothetical protein AMJ45_00195 [Syntrophobacter sp. DG_60]